MKKKSLYESLDITRACMYCENAEILDKLNACLCKKKGVVDPNYQCGKFKYDLTKRKPVKKKSSIPPLQMDEDPDLF